MTKEEKQLLLKDLCARLPYGVVCKISYTFNNETTDWEDVESTCDDIITKINFDTKKVFSDWLSEYSSIDDVKPYLRPMSSMTEEERAEFRILISPEASCTYEDCLEWDSQVIGAGHLQISVEDFSLVIDWLNAHHIDYHGLIEKGLALEAPEGMY